MERRSYGAVRIDRTLQALKVILYPPRVFRFLQYVGVFLLCGWIGSDVRDRFRQAQKGDSVSDCGTYACK